MRLLIAACLLTSVAGCRALGLRAFAPPVVALRDVSLSRVNLLGGTLDVSVSVRNPNSYRLDASRLTYTVIVDSSEVGSGEVNRSMSVNARDSTIVQLPVDFTFIGLGAVARKLQSNGQLEYRVVGELIISTPVGKIAQPYDQKGIFQLFGNSRH